MSTPNVITGLKVYINVIGIFLTLRGYHIVPQTDYKGEERSCATTNETERPDSKHKGRRRKGLVADEGKGLGSRKGVSRTRTPSFNLKFFGERVVVIEEGEKTTILLKVTVE